MEGPYRVQEPKGQIETWWKYAPRIVRLLARNAKTAQPRAMKFLIFCLLLPAALHAELKWERTSQRIAWKPGQKEASTEFAYTNTGKSPVKITDVRGACVCCTSAHATKLRLAPGESGVVKVRVDFQGKTLPMTKPVTISTDDGKITALMVEVTTPGSQPVTIPRAAQHGRGR